MGETTEIGWTDATFNPWIGCQKVAAGCTHCYAESFAKRYGKAEWGANGTRVKTSDRNWKLPLKWDQAAHDNQSWHSANSSVDPPRPRVFCSSLADIFEDWQGPIVDHHGIELCRCLGCGKLCHYINGDCGGDDPKCERLPRRVTMDDLRADLFKLIDATPNLDWQLLTKRPENIPKMWPKCSYHINDEWGSNPVPRRRNVWIGTSIAEQADADRNIPLLLKCRELSPVLFLSMEPLVGPVCLQSIPHAVCGTFDALDGRSWDDSESDGKSCSSTGGIDWVIVGGESGHGARPLHPQWARDIRDQCQSAGVPFFFKQWGEFQNGSKIGHKEAAVLNNGRFVFPDSHEGRHNLDRELRGEWDRFEPLSMAKVGKKIAGRILDGRTWDEFPEVAR